MILFLVLALLGFVASVVVHLSTFAAPPGLGMGRTFLHLGMFVVFIPMALGQRNDRGAGGARGGRSAASFASAPAWMRTVLAVCVAYALVTFGMMIVNGPTHLADEARSVRGVSAYWMVVYLASFVGLYDATVRRRAARAATPWPPVLPASMRNTNRYERAPTPRMSPWAHATVGTILALVGFFALPMVVAGLFLSAKPSGGAWILLVAPLFFGSAIVGIRLPGALMSRHVAAACPGCGGRAYANELSLGGGSEGDVCYTCRDCGRVSRTDGSEVESPRPANSRTA